MSIGGPGIGSRTSARGLQARDPDEHPTILMLHRLRSLNTSTMKSLELAALFQATAVAAAALDAEAVALGVDDLMKDASNKG